MDGLIQSPVPGQLQVGQKLAGPHAVVLKQHPLGLVTAVNLLQKLSGELLRVLNGNQAAVALGEKFLVVLLLPVLAHKQDGALAVVEVVHIQRVAEQGGLAGVQKAGDEIQWNPGIRHVGSPHYASRNSFSS